MVGVRDREMTMTALEIINKLKANRNDAALWINHNRKEAAVHPGVNYIYAVSVSYIDAMVARGDPNLNIEKLPSGELITA